MKRIALLFLGCFVIQMPVKADINPTICLNAQDSFTTYICSDPTLRDSGEKLDRSLSRTYEHLSNDSSQALKASEQDWFFNLGSQCGLSNPRDPAQRLKARDCILDKIEKRRQELDAMPTNGNETNYRLSALERLIVRDYSEIHSSFGDLFWVGKPMMTKTLNRLLAEVIGSKPEISEFQKAISGPGSGIEYSDDRFAFGVLCTRHSCSYAQGGFIADTKTGDIVFAINQPDSQLRIYEKSCANDDLKQFALLRFQKPWDSSGINADKRHSDASTDIKVSKCADTLVTAVQIDQKTGTSNHGLRQKFVGPRIKEPRFAEYVSDWRKTVERIGALNFPVEAKQKKIFGSVQLTVSVLPDGSLKNTEIVRSSGTKFLDDAALHIIKLVFPFKPFSNDIRRDTDILNITDTLNFTQTGKLNAESGSIVNVGNPID